MAAGGSSLRWTLGTMAAALVGLGAYFLVVGMAVRGSAWAIGIAVGAGSLAISMLLYAVAFLVVWAVALLRRPVAVMPFAEAPAPQPPAAADAAAESPFATDAP
jgi:hypothetical protein